MRTQSRTRVIYTRNHSLRCALHAIAVCNWLLLVDCVQGMAHATRHLWRQYRATRAAVAWSNVDQDQ
jgi:hypothetical protein